MLESETAHVYDINLPGMTALMEERYHTDYPVAYLKCPICSQFMNRVYFGVRSGVVVDKCRNHGVWLDSGELRQLLEWVKSGGAILEQKRAEERRREEEQQRKVRAKEEARMFQRLDGEGSSEDRLSSRKEQGLLDLLARWAGKLIK